MLDMDVGFIDSDFLRGTDIFCNRWAFTSILVVFIVQKECFVIEGMTTRE